MAEKKNSTSIKEAYIQLYIIADRLCILSRDDSE